MEITKLQVSIYSVYVFGVTILALLMIVLAAYRLMRYDTEINDAVTDWADDSFLAEP
jgi:ABC-type glycerol-3-phosphate transport system permease component